MTHFFYYQYFILPSVCILPLVCVMLLIFMMNTCLGHGTKESKITESEVFQDKHGVVSSLTPTRSQYHSLQSAIYPQSAFYPWSTVCSLRFTLNDCIVSNYSGTPLIQSPMGHKPQKSGQLSSVWLHYQVLWTAKWLTGLLSRPEESGFNITRWPN